MLSESLGGETTELLIVVGLLGLIVYFLWRVFFKRRRPGQERSSRKGWGGGAADPTVPPPSSQFARPDPPTPATTGISAILAGMAAAMAVMGEGALEATELPGGPWVFALLAGPPAEVDKPPPRL